MEDLGGLAPGLPPAKPETPSPNPRDFDLFEKARSLQLAGQLQQAEHAYRELLEREPLAHRALNNLGAVLEAQGHIAESELAYRRAVEVAPTVAALHYNLGHLLHQDGRLDLAEVSYRRAIELEPGSFDAHFNLGLLLQGQGRLSEAVTAIERAAALEIGSIAAQGCLGDLCYDLQRLDAALAAYVRAAEIDPESAATWFDVGKTLEALGRLDEAATAYRRVLDCNPDSVAAREHLGHVLSAAGRRRDAIAFLRQWLEREPDHPIAQHMLAATTGDNVPSRASDDYVRLTFDRFAVDFDATLDRLEYRAPERAVGALLEILGPGSAPLDILDAGCGTGLCGALLRPHARRLTGVDLSAGMLERARARGAYDELVEEELTAFLARHDAAYDAIVCVDTLCYFGALDEVLRAAAGALRPSGRLLFTLERLTEPTAEGHRLSPNGRYRHDPDHVERSLRRSGLHLRQMEDCALRREGGVPVAGLLVAAGPP